MRRLLVLVLSCFLLAVPASAKHHRRHKHHSAHHKHKHSSHHRHHKSAEQL